ncbi:hypothetical protein C6N75_01970 [Streptomyces solincola]|uniref:histidine kinase n=1 Tax=Streptomyces solincola TaxID=2100817 RepID=A0A2S9Q2E5_9ACTN|nr:HAMP domain-containing sensor histidine kinase [Streptomyces solincola]PRH80841.1 hypothetical protein C6N75_01970 [Streptomyces solincola]
MRRRIALLASVSTFVCLLLFCVPFVAFLRGSYVAHVDELADVNAQIAASAVAARRSDDAAVLRSVEDERVPQAQIAIRIGRGVPYGRPDACVRRAGEQARPGPTRVTDCGSRRVATRATTTRDGVRAWVAVAIETSDQWRSLAVVIGLAVAAMLLLPLVAVLVAERLGRSMVRPVDALVRAAGRVSDGDLGTRVVPAGPPEIARMGQTFNELVRRIEELINNERETLADLSHRLRSPVTVLMLQAEALPDAEDSTRLLASVERLQRQLDEVIDQARTPSPALSCGSGPTDLRVAVARCARQWRLAVHGEGRRCDLRSAGSTLPVDLTEKELMAVIDILVDNVLKHTPPGTALAVSTRAAPDGRAAVLAVEDAGPGIHDARAVERGRSGADSSGLGLDIVRRTVEGAGGDLRIGVSDLGGARVEVTLPLALPVRPAGPGPGGPGHP